MTRLVPMGADRYAAYVRRAAGGFADDMVAGGRWTPTSALERSQAEFAALLPEGLRTPGHQLYDVVAEDGTRVGHLWLFVRLEADDVHAFVYDLGIDEPFRRRGFASQALLAAEAIACSAGARTIGLNVFAENEAARSLYRKLGYEPSRITLRKSIGPWAAVGRSRE